MDTKPKFLQTPLTFLCLKFCPYWYFCDKQPMCCLGVLSPVALLFRQNNISGVNIGEESDRRLLSACLPMFVQRMVFIVHLVGKKPNTYCRVYRQQRKAVIVFLIYESLCCSYRAAGSFSWILVISSISWWVAQWDRLITFRVIFSCLLNVCPSCT